jgi:hypothetical protein
VSILKSDSTQVNTKPQPRLPTPQPTTNYQVISRIGNRTGKKGAAGGKLGPVRFIGITTLFTDFYKFHGYLYIPPVVTLRRFAFLIHVVFMLFT